MNFSDGDLGCDQWIGWGMHIQNPRRIREFVKNKRTAKCFEKMMAQAKRIDAKRPKKKKVRFVLPEEEE